MTQSAIEVEGLGKRYRIGLKEQMHQSIASAAVSWLRSPLDNLKKLRDLSRFSDDEQREDLVWALRDVSFEVPEAEVVGIIGRNGAGKTTLLKILSRITEPSTGVARVRGRVSSLLEVGTGFHPELSGRENIYLNGTILGMSRAEINRSFDQIVEFSGIGRFLDTPVKRYSSGMKVRLAFSVAAHLEPEILMIDEVLAVGDLEFQKKCLGRMSEVAGEGRTVLFVSHQLGAVKTLCDSLILLEGGRVAYRGELAEGIRKYAGTFEQPVAGGAASSGWQVVRVNGEPGTCKLQSGEPMSITAEFHNAEESLRAKFFVILTNAEGETVFHRHEEVDDLQPGPQLIEVDLPALWLSSGFYSLELKCLVEGLVRSGGKKVAPPYLIDVVADQRGAGKQQPLLAPPAEWVIRPERTPARDRSTGA